MTRARLRSRADWALLAPLALAFAGVLLARAIAHLALRDFPHVMDEIAYVLQARTFADGHLTAPVHLPRAAFALWFVDDRWATFSIFPPGWPAVLAIGESLGIPSWINPLLHGATALVVGTLAGRLSGARARVIAVGAYAFSPQALLLAASLMSHALVALFAAVLALASVDVALGRRRPASAWCAGVALGALMLTRPLCAIVAACGLAAVLGWTIAKLWRAGSSQARRSGARRVAAALARIALPVFVASVSLGAYNRALTGHATRFPQSAYFDEHQAPLDDPQFYYRPGCNELGFGPGHGCDYGIPHAAHDLANALSNTGDNLRAWLLLADGGPLVFLAVAWAIVTARRRALVLAVAAPIPAAIVAYGLYWYAGTSYGARFYHAALPALVALAACGLAHLLSPRRQTRQIVQPVESASHETRWPRRVGVGLAAAALAWNAFATWSASGEISQGYWGTDDRFARVATTWRDGPALVMVAFAQDRPPTRVTYFWTTFLRDTTWRNSVRALSALAVNTPRLTGDVVFAKYHPALVPELHARFPERELWLYVVEDDRHDRLVRYEGSPLVQPPSANGDDSTALRPPRDNFDAFVIDAK